jgi:hypothetical protein
MMIAAQGHGAELRRGQVTGIFPKWIDGKRC